MRFLTSTCGLFPAAFGVCVWFASTCYVVAQNNNNNQNNQNNQQNLAGVAGIEIDATGVLRVMEVDPSISNAQRMATLRNDGKANKTSPLRKVSLNRLEKFIASEIEAGRDLDLEVLSLAGLNRIEYVFYLPDSQDIVIAGSADQWHLDVNNRVVGLNTGRSTLRLDDLVVALRAFAPDTQATQSIGCSIDPTEEGLKRMKKYQSSLGDSLQAGFNAQQVQQIALGYKESLGLQTVSIKGIPRNTHFAQVLVEADYRMKLIGIGLQDPMVPMTTWIQRTRGANNAMERWFFEADYSSVSTNPDGTALHLQGLGVRLTGEKEMVSKDGKRSAAGGSVDKASRGFTTEFTQKFEAIASMSPVFYEMRNLFDMSIAAAFIQDRGLYQKSGWSLGVLAKEDQVPVHNTTAITQVETAVNAVFKESQLITPVGGGVYIAARKTIDPARTKVEAGIEAKREKLAAPANLAENQWWWD